MGLINRKSIRHPKKELENIRKSEKITFYNLLYEVDLDPERYKRVLQKMFLNVFVEEPIRHINKYLGKDDYQYMKRVIYFLGSLGFRFTDIRSLFLDLFGEGKSARWAKEYSKEIGEDLFLQKPVNIYLYDENSKLQESCDEYAKKSEYQYARKERQKERLNEIIDMTMDRNIV